MRLGETPAPEREGVGREGKKGRVGAGAKEGGGQDGARKRRRKGARESGQKAKTEGSEGGSSSGLAPLLGSVWQVPRRPSPGPAKPHRLLPGWLPDQGHAEVGACPEATPGQVEKEGTRDFHASGNITVGWATSAAIIRESPLPQAWPLPRSIIPSLGCLGLKAKVPPT